MSSPAARWVSGVDPVPAAATAVPERGVSVLMAGGRASHVAVGQGQSPAVRAGRPWLSGIPAETCCPINYWVNLVFTEPSSRSHRCTLGDAPYRRNFA